MAIIWAWCRKRSRIAPAVGKPMNIMAAINVGKRVITSTWPLLDGESYLKGEQTPLLEFNKLPDGKSVVLRLDADRIKDMKGIEAAQKTYLGTLNLSDAEIVPLP